MAFFMLKLFFAIIAVFLFFGCLTQNGSQLIQENQETQGQGKQIIVLIEVVSGEQKLVDSSLELPVGINAFEAVKKATQIKFQEFSFGVFVTSIAGISADQKHYWALYVDNKYAEKGIDQIVLEKDTQIKWVLEEIK